MPSIAFPKQGKDRNSWTPKLTRKLVDSVNVYGVGSWTAILSLGFPPEITGMKLKDKWRNLVKFTHVRKTANGRWVLL